MERAVPAVKATDKDHECRHQNHGNQEALPAGAGTLCPREPAWLVGDDPLALDPCGGAQARAGTLHGEGAHQAVCEWHHPHHTQPQQHQDDGHIDDPFEGGTDAHDRGKVEVVVGGKLDEPRGIEHDSEDEKSEPDGERRNLEESLCPEACRASLPAAFFQE